MVMERDWFVFYKSFITGIDTIPDAAEQLKAYKYIIRYWIFWECPEEENSIAYGFFSMAKPQIDANNKRFANGKKWWQFWHLWWAPEWNQNAVKSWNNSQNNPNGVEQNNPKTTPKDKEKEKEKEKEKGYGGKQDTQITLDANASRWIVEKKSVVGEDKDKYEANGIKLSDKLSELWLEDEIIGLAVTYNSCKKWKKLDKFKDAQLKIRVDKLRRCWFNTIEWMKQVLENSIAWWYQWIFELKQKPNIKPKPIEEWKVVNVNWANIFF